MSNPNRPTEFDAVLGNQSVAPSAGAVLGGIEGLKKRLAGDNTPSKISALNTAIQYGEVGLRLVIQHLEDPVWEIQNVAYELLEQCPETFVQERIKNHKGIRKYTRHSNRFDLFEKMGREGTAANIDIMMESLELDPHSSPYKIIDYALGLVRKVPGKQRIEHYLFNGTAVQRNYAALYFKRLKEVDVLAEAVKMGCIDRVQAFSK
jgi:hypothetical protein